MTKKIGIKYREGRTRIVDDRDCDFAIIVPDAWLRKANRVIADYDALMTEIEILVSEARA